MREIGTFIRIDDKATHSKGWHRMPTYNDSISRIAAINRARSLQWHKGPLTNWSLSDWAVAFAGEAGELCNVVKKLNRVRDGLVGNRESNDTLCVMLRAEIADCYLYLDLFAQAAGVSLAEAVRDKFNAVSERNGFAEKL
jgi:NTP pyrophosphatase (non-canonical NTP hydrolase)